LLQNQKLQMRKREEIPMVQDHQVQEQKRRNEQTLEEGRIVPKGRLVV
jgi:hypothetical protein